MCWSGIKNESIAKIAVENIPVFKICVKDLHGRVVPYYYPGSLVYDKGLTYRSEVNCVRSSIGIYKIDVGLHSYSPKCTIVVKSYNWVNILSPELLKIGEYYVSLDTTCMLLCVIPKGSIYYVNKNGEYVSSKLTVIDVVELHRDSSVWNKVLNKWVYRININN